MVQQKKIQEKTRGWGVIDANTGAEIWDADPVFRGAGVGVLGALKLLCYPKRFVLYRFIAKHVHALCKRYAKIEGGEKYVPKILDVGCGTGSSVIDLKKMFGRRVDVYGADVVALQIDLAKEKMKRFGVWAEFVHVDGIRLPFADATFDAVYTSDVLGHVEDVGAWMKEIHRVLRPGGVLAMFTESKLGKHAYLRNYFLRHGLNTDPHVAFHISLFSKATIRELLESSGFSISCMYTTVWAKFLVHPEELRPAFQAHDGLVGWNMANAILATFKRWTHPVSTAIAELYSLLEMLTIGRWIESQGYVVLGEKKL